MTTNSRPVSLLFVPGHRERMVAKAREVRAQAVVFDLEDSVPQGEKDAAREQVVSALGNWPEDGPIRPFVRINPPRARALAEDAQVLESNPTAGIVVPKVDRPIELAGLVDHPALRGRELIVTIETPRALLHVEEFADSPLVDGLCLGGEDLAFSMGFERTELAGEFAIPRFLILAACRAAGIGAYDSICPDFRDLSVVERDAATGVRLGFDGKFAIHPAQIDAIHRAFQPSDDELTVAREIVDAYNEAVREGRGAVAVHGQMIDPPVAERYRLLLNRAARLAGTG